MKYAPLDSTIRIDVSTTDTDVHIAIEDEGPGISAHEQESLFAPFTRLSAEPTGDEGSSGLGLYIVKQIVERHGGTVNVTSTFGKGSTFTIVLPRAESEELGESKGIDNTRESMNSNTVEDTTDRSLPQNTELHPQFASPVIGELHR